jgi:hypothetical protein
MHVDNPVPYYLFPVAFCSDCQTKTSVVMRSASSTSASILVICLRCRQVVNRKQSVKMQWVEHVTLFQETGDIAYPEYTKFNLKWRVANAAR